MLQKLDSGVSLVQPNDATQGMDRGITKSIRIHPPEAIHFQGKFYSRPGVVEILHLDRQLDQLQLQFPLQAEQ